MQPASQFEFTVSSTHPGQAGQLSSIPLQAGTGVLGRALDCDYVLPDENRILSRRHAEITCMDGQVFWTDLGANATQINGQALHAAQRVRLQAGDDIRVASYVLVLQNCRPAELWCAVAEPEGVSPDIEALHPERHALSIDDLIREQPAPVLPDIQSPLMAMHVPLPRQGVPLARPSAPPMPLEPLRQILGLPENVMLDAHQLGLIGALLTIFMEGLLTMQSNRRVFRSELGVANTVFASTSNNPLKYATSPTQAILQLLSPTRQGFLPARQAVQKSIDEVLEHQQSSLEIVRGLVRDLHAHLAPEILDAALPQALLDGLGLTVGRKARLWDQYCAVFAQLCGDADDPFAAVVRQAAASHGTVSWK